MLLLLAMVVSDKAGLDTLHWMLKQFMTVEADRYSYCISARAPPGLEQLGRGRFRRSYWNPQEFDQMLEELMKAIPVLVKKRIGALIVLERETGLKELIETGIRIDGTVSAELLINIFFPRTPLHDGALIMQGNHVAAAGCYLPPTDDPYLNKELGTRHRAGSNYRAV